MLHAISEMMGNMLDEKIIPVKRIERLEDDIAVLKVTTRTLESDVNELK